MSRSRDQNEKSALVALAVAMMAVAVAVGQPVAGASFNWVIGRNPGSARITSEFAQPPAGSAGHVHIVGSIIQRPHAIGRG
jgi:hypothetical protein